MFTLEQIEEIHRKLQLFGVKDKDLPILTEQLSGNEIITVVKDGRNVLLLISQLLDFNSFTAELLESLRGPQGNDGKDAYQTWLSQGNVGTYDDYIAVLQLPALLAAETSSIRINNKLNEADVIIEELNLLSNQTQESLSEMNSAKDLAYETVTHPPVIIDKYWHSWNYATNQYDTTYIKAEGDSAYLLWLEAGNVGTLEDYLEDIKGDPFIYSDFTPEQLESLKVKGDPFLYTEFTPEQIVELQRPATDAVTAVNEAEALRVTAETTRVENEQGRVTAEGTRQQNETLRIDEEDDRDRAEALRLSAEITRGQNEQARITAEELRATSEGTRQTNTATAITNANNAATNANTKAGLADTAANNANEKATLANNAATLANEKAGLANTAALNADNARLAIQTDLGLKLDKSAVKQTIGTSETDVMSQKAVTDELAKKHEVVVNYTHTGNKEVNIESIDFATGTITATEHRLAANNDVFVTNNQDNTLTFPYAAVPNGLELGKRYYPVNITTNTFQLSATGIGGSPIAISDKATKDYTKWHLERSGNVKIENLSLRKFIVEFSGRSNGVSGSTDYFYLYGGKNYGTAGDVWHVDTERLKIGVGSLSRSILGTMANGDIWMYSRLEIDVTGKRATILVNGYRIYSVNDTTRGIIRHINEVAVHSTVGDDTITSFYQASICNGINIKVTKIL